MNEIYTPQPGDRVYHRLSPIEYKGVVVSSDCVTTYVQWDNKPSGAISQHGTGYMVLICRPKPPVTRTETTWETANHPSQLTVGDTVKLSLDRDGRVTRGTVTDVRPYSFDVSIDQLVHPLPVTFDPAYTDAFHVSRIEKQVTREVVVNLPTEPGLYVSPVFAVFQLRDNGEWWNPASNQKVSQVTITAAKHQPLNKVVSA